MLPRRPDSRIGFQSGRLFSVGRFGRWRSPIQASAPMCLADFTKLDAASGATRRIGAGSCGVGARDLLGRAAFLDDIADRTRRARALFYGFAARADAMPVMRNVCASFHRVFPRRKAPGEGLPEGFPEAFHEGSREPFADGAPHNPAIRAACAVASPGLAKASRASREASRS